MDRQTPEREAVAGADGSRPATAARTATAVAMVILALALGARIGFAVWSGHLQLANDPADYQRLAVSIAHGHGFGTTVVAPGGGPTAFRPPLFPLVLAALYRVVGVHLAAARGLEALLGTLTVALVGLVARQLWDGRRALAAMGLAAVYPPFLLAGGSLLSESLSLPLELGGFAAALHVRRVDRPGRWIALCGLLAGLDVLTRPDSIVLLLPLALLVAPARRRGRARIGAVALLGVTAAATVTPWLIRDAVVMGRFVPITTQGGLVASGTYNDTAAHDAAHPAAWRSTNLVPEYVPLLRGSEVQEESALRSAALRYVRRHPTYPLRVVGWNVVRLFDLDGLGTPRASWGANGYGPGPAASDAVGLAVVGVLVFVGLAAGAARGVPRAIWLAPVLLVLITAMVLGESRLRLGVDPFLVLLGGAGAAAVAVGVRPGTLRLPAAARSPAAGRRPQPGKSPAGW